MEWKMPDLGEGVQEAEILKWLVKPGERVSMDQHLVEVMTDKATMEIPSSFEGRVQKILVKEGEVAKVGQALAVIEGEGEEEVVIARGEAPKQSPGGVAGLLRPSGPRNDTRGKPLASPAIRSLAREKGIDLESIQGSGPGGRIVKEDLVHGPRSTVRGSQSVVRGPEQRQPLRGLRRKIAEHMSHSRKHAAHFTHVDEADLTALVALRESAQEAAKAKGVKLTYLPYVIKAVVEGLKKYPQMNASLDEEKQEVILKGYYNIGVAVATGEGLIVPVVKKADQLDLWDLAKEISRLGEAARNKKIALDELKDGTFTLTNIGSIGGVLSAPIINWPEVAIMGLHQIKPRVVAKDGAMVIRSMMYLSISADHRVVDGAEVASFCKAVIGYLEHPARLF